MKLNRRSLFIGAVTLMAQILLASIVLAQSGPETREYGAENGYKITITSRGNIIGLEIPGRVERVEGAEPREGYVISYVDSAGVVRVVHDVYDNYSAGIRPGERDFIQGSFTAPPSQSRIPLNTLISATAVVDTRDGLLRLSNEITWRAGTGVINVKMTVANRSDRQSMRVINVKRVFAPLGLDMDPASLITAITADSIGQSGQSDDKCNSANFINGKGLRTPPPPPPPLDLPRITMSRCQPLDVSIARADDLYDHSRATLISDVLAYVLIARADDLYDLQNVGPGESLGDYVTGVQTQGILAFQINSVIAPQGSAGGRNISYGMR